MGDATGIPLMFKAVSAAPDRIKDPKPEEGVAAIVNEAKKAKVTRTT